MIVLAVRWYLRFRLSYHDVEELLAERGIEVDHVTVYRWVQRFTPLLVDAARPCRHAVGDRWFVDETYVKVAGRWRYVGYRYRCDGNDTTSLSTPAASIALMRGCGAMTFSQMSSRALLRWMQIGRVAGSKWGPSSRQTHHRGSFGAGQIA
jgi:hypothetical protein